MHTAISRITLLAAVLASALQAGEPVVFCPGPAERDRSPFYDVRSATGEPAFVYYHENGWTQVPDKNGGNWECKVMSADNHWVSLSATEEVHLTVRAVGIEATRVELLPERPGNTATVAADGSVHVKLALAAEHPGYYFVRINGAHGDKHPLFTLYWPGRTLRNLVIWKQMNQAVFQLGYGYPLTVKDILVEKVEIIRDETETQNGHRGIVVLCASKGCAFSNVRFRDMKVYGDTLNLLAIDNLNQDTPWSAKIENVTLREIDLVLQRVTVTGTERGRWWGPFKDREGQPMRSRLRTADPGRIKVLFEDVSINGVRLESEKNFPNGLETQGDVRLEFR